VSRKNRKPRRSPYLRLLDLYAAERVALELQDEETADIARRAWKALAQDLGWGPSWGYHEVKAETIYEEPDFDSLRGKRKR